MTSVGPTAHHRMASWSVPMFPQTVHFLPHAARRACIVQTFRQHAGFKPKIKYRRPAIAKDIQRAQSVAWITRSKQKARPLSALAAKAPPPSETWKPQTNRQWRPSTTTNWDRTPKIGPYFQAFRLKVAMRRTVEEAAKHVATAIKLPSGESSLTVRPG